MLYDNMCIQCYQMYVYVVYNCVTFIKIGFLLLFTTCTLLTLSLDLDGGIGTCETTPSQT